MLAAMMVQEGSPKDGLQCCWKQDLLDAGHQINLHVMHKLSALAVWRWVKGAGRQKEGGKGRGKEDRGGGEEGQDTRAGMLPQVARLRGKKVAGKVRRGRGGGGGGGAAGADAEARLPLFNSSFGVN